MAGIKAKLSGLFQTERKPIEKKVEGTVKVLFTGAGQRVELVSNFLYAAGTLGVEIETYGADVTDTEPAVLRCHHRMAIPGVEEPGYVEAVEQICKENKIDIIVPLGQDEFILAKEKTRFEKMGCLVLISDYRVSDMCRHLNRVDGFLRTCGLKPAIGNEEKIYDGDYYEIDTFSDRSGNTVYITPRMDIEKNGKKSGRYRIVQDERLIREAKMILNKLKPVGPLTISVRRNRVDQEDYFLDFSPFLAENVPVSIKAGADIPLAVLRILYGEQLSYYENAAEEAIEYGRYSKTVQIKESHNKIYPIRDYIELLNLGKDIEAIIFDMDSIITPSDASVDEFVEVRLRNDVKDILKKLREQGKHIGLVADGDVAVQDSRIDDLGIREMFDEIIISDELAGKSNVKSFRKPNDIAYIVMRRRFGINLRNMAYVGCDVEKDFIAPTRLDMRCCHYVGK